MIEYVAPGVYLEDRSAEGRILHLDMDALLTYFSYADTPANRDRLATTAIAVFRERFPDTGIAIVERHE